MLSKIKNFWRNYSGQIIQSVSEIFLAAYAIVFYNRAFVIFVILLFLFKTISYRFFAESYRESSSNWRGLYETVKDENIELMNLNVGLMMKSIDPEICHWRHVVKKGKSMFVFGNEDKSVEVDTPFTLEDLYHGWNDS